MLRRKSGRHPPFVRRRMIGTVGIRLARPRSIFGSAATVPAIGDHTGRTLSRPGPAPVGGRLAAAGRRVCRKYRKASIRRLQQQEYDKLCRIVPALATRRHRRRISKVTVTSSPSESTWHRPQRCFTSSVFHHRGTALKLQRGQYEAKRLAHISKQNVPLNIIFCGGSGPTGPPQHLQRFTHLIEEI